MEFVPLWERDSHEEGFKKGEKKGEKKGRKEEKIETAKKMISDNLPLETIAKYTDLSQEEIKALMH